MRFQSTESSNRKTGLLLVGLFVPLCVVASITCSPTSQTTTVNFPDTSGNIYRSSSNKFDVPYVPTLMTVMRTFLELGSVGPDDFLIDLGSGDGRIVITAAKEYGARGFGVDLNENLVTLSKKYAAAAGVGDRVDFFVRDLFETDVQEASVVTLYLLNDVNLKLRPKLLAELRPGSRILSQDFHLGEWRPDSMVHLDVEKIYQDDTVLYLWIVPANVIGRWSWNLSLYTENIKTPSIYTYDLALNQNFQDIHGVVTSGGYDLQIFDASLSGDTVQFSVYAELDERMVRHDYKGRVQGDRIVGTVRLKGTFLQDQLEWIATRGER